MRNADVSSGCYKNLAYGALTAQACDPDLGANVTHQELAIGSLTLPSFHTLAPGVILCYLVFLLDLRNTHLSLNGGPLTGRDLKLGK